MIRGLLKKVDEIGYKYNLKAYQTHSILAALMFFVLLPFSAAFAVAFPIGFYLGREEKDYKQDENHDFREILFPIVVSIILFGVFGICN